MRLPAAGEGDELAAPRLTHPSGPPLANLSRLPPGVSVLLPGVRWVLVIAAVSGERFTLGRPAVDGSEHLANRPRPGRFRWIRGSSTWSLAAVLRCSSLTYFVSICSRLTPRTPAKSTAQLSTRPTESSRQRMIPSVLQERPPDYAWRSSRVCSIHAWKPGVRARISLTNVENLALTPLTAFTNAPILSLNRAKPTLSAGLDHSLPSKTPKANS